MAPEAEPVTPAARWPRCTALALEVAAALLAVLLYAVRPASLAEGYLRHVFPRLVHLLGGVAARSPVCASELALAAIFGAVAIAAVILLVRVVRRRVPVGAAIARAGRFALAFVSFAFIVFVLAAGFATARPPVEQRIGIDPATVRGEDLLAAAIHLMEDVARAREEMGSVPRLATEKAADWLRTGRSADFPFDPARTALAAQAAAGDAVLVLEGRRFDEFFPVRSPFPDTLVHRFGATGIADPLLGEIIVSPHQSAILWVASLPHEYSHAAGILREREAELYACVGGGRSKDPLVRYAVSLYGARLLTRAAKRRGVAHAWNRAAAALPSSARNEIQLLVTLEQRGAFAPGGAVRLGADGKVSATSGAPPGAARMAVATVIGGAVGLPPDYDSAAPLIAAWVLGR